MSQTQTQAPEQPAIFKATYYVDPGFTGIQLGSSANPFTTCAAAFTAALALSLTSAIVYLPPGINLTENVVFPTTGNDWEIACMHGAVGTISAGITGTITANPTGATRYRLTEIFVTGLISGASPSGSSQFIMTRVRNTGGITLTGTWFASFNGRGQANSNGFSGNSGAVSVAGTIFAKNWVYNSTVAYTGGSIFDNCFFANGTIGGNTTLRLTDCVFNLATTITDSTTTVDGTTLTSMLGPGLTLAGAATLKTLNANGSVQQIFANNITATNVVIAPLGLYEVVATMDLVTAGTAGSAVLNVIYTDLTGAVITAAVTGALLVTAVVGTEVRGSFVFRHKGGAAIQYSVTGIVTPGALSINLSVAVMRRD